MKFNDSYTTPDGPGIKVQGTLTAEGTGSELIVFTSVNDDSVGGATGSGTAAAGSWDKILFEATSVNSVLNYVVVKYGGYVDVSNCTYNDCDRSAIQVYSASVTISNSEVSENLGGIWLEGVSPQIVGNYIFNNISEGIYVNSGSPEIRDNIIGGNDSNGIHMINGSLPVITGNTFNSNGNYGIYNSDSLIIVMAENNSWGDPSGPYDPSDDTATGGLYNPGGSGDRVSDNVDYLPWLDMIDADGDGYPAGMDCNDGNPLEHPGQIWYVDNDSDGFGNAAVYLQQCNQPVSYVPDNNDYDDNNATLGAPVMIDGGTTYFYSSLQDAYDAAADGDTIKVIFVTINEDLFIDRNISVTLQGGYDGSYTAISGDTTLQGIMDVSEGTIAIEHFTFQ